MKSYILVVGFLLVSLFAMFRLSLPNKPEGDLPLSLQEIGAFRFTRYSPVLSRYSYRDSSPYTEIEYGSSRGRISFQTSFRDNPDWVIRLPSSEPAWLLGGRNTQGRLYLGLLRESTGDVVQMPWGDCSDEGCSMRRIDNDRWYVPAQPFKGGAQIFNVKTLKLSPLTLSLPVTMDNYESEATLVALTPDDKAATWLVSEATGEDGVPYRFWLGTATLSSKLQRLDLSPKWLEQHPYPHAAWLHDEDIQFHLRNTDQPVTDLPDAPQTQQWFNQFFQWKKSDDGAWSAHWLPSSNGSDAQVSGKPAR